MVPILQSYCSPQSRAHCTLAHNLWSSSRMTPLHRRSGAREWMGGAGSNTSAGNTVSCSSGADCLCLMGRLSPASGLGPRIEMPTCQKESKRQRSLKTHCLSSLRGLRHCILSVTPCPHLHACAALHTKRLARSFTVNHPSGTGQAPLPCIYHCLGEMSKDDQPYNNESGW